MNENLITIADACTLLGISRPTFNSWRGKYFLTVTEVKGQLLYKKDEVIRKIFAAYPQTVKPIDFHVLSDSKTDDLKVDSTTFDLRRIRLIDTYSLLSILCAVLNLADSGSDINLIVDGRSPCAYLKTFGFFEEVRRLSTQIYWDESILGSLPKTDNREFFPLKYIGYRGKEREVADELVGLLIKQGFSDTIAGLISWIFGELADNSHTHAKGPCYFSSDWIKYKERRYLLIGIADRGVGIHNSLKKNPKYSMLSDKDALLTSFKTNVSSWPDEAKRGKGLSDVLGIALGTRSCLRVDSCELGLHMNFSDYSRSIQARSPTTTTPGTRFCLLLFDKEYKEIGREMVDSVVSEFIGKI